MVAYLSWSFVGFWFSQSYPGVRVIHEVDVLTFSKLLLIYEFEGRIRASGAHCS